MMLKDKTILLGVTGGIAAYKSAMLASRLVKTGACVHVIMTQNATNFINPITFETLTRNKCIVDTFDRNFEFKVEHVALAQKADVIMVAPATANIIAKLAHGLADDMLTTTILASKAPKIIAPAMNTGMYENPVTQDNLKLLEKYGMEVITPANGWLACGDVGAGKMPEPEDLFEYILKCIACKKDLRGKKVLVTGMDMIFKAAAVADYRPVHIADEKIKKSDSSTSIELERTDDILKYLGEHKTPGQFLCGFSMETENMLENSRKKLKKKNLDMVVANNLKVAGAGFETDTNVVTMITDTEVLELPIMNKEEVAFHIIDQILSMQNTDR